MADFERIYSDNVAVVVVNLSRCTIYYQKEFKKIIEDELKEGKCKLIIDLAKCEYIGSHFLSALVGTVHRVNEKCGKIKIVEPENLKQDTFDETGTRQLFDFYKTSVDALKSFEKNE